LAKTPKKGQRLWQWISGCSGFFMRRGFPFNTPPLSRICKPVTARDDSPAMQVETVGEFLDRVKATAPRQSMRYRSSFDMEVLIRAATRELDIEGLKVFLLAGMAGLRRNEIDKLQWKAFHWIALFCALTLLNTWKQKLRIRSAKLI
jgi:hypothetical protein